MSLIQKSDFPGIVQFTENIEDRILTFHINDAEKFDFVPRVPDDFYTDIQVVESPADELYTFRLNYVVPLLVCFAYKRFLLWAGRNITQYGIRQINEDTSVEVTDKARSELQNDIQSKINVYLARFYSELKAVDYTFDGVTYDFDCKTKKLKIRISSV